MNELYMEKALEQAKKALKINEVPIGCVIVKNNEIISKSYNQKEKHHNCLYHAEIIAINRACKKLKTWHLENCKIYVTVEPCVMCMGAIAHSRISEIIYATNNQKFGYSNFVKNDSSIMNYKIKIENGILKEKSELLMKKFFANKRKINNRL